MNAFYNIYLLLYYSFRRVHCPFMANLLYVMHAAVVAAAATTAQCSLLLLSIYLVFFFVVAFVHSACVSVIHLRNKSISTAELAQRCAHTYAFFFLGLNLLFL